MVLGVCTITLYIPSSNSLKNKRGVLKSLIHRMKNKFNVSVCELDQQDMWRRSTLGIACISNEQRFVHRMFSDIEKFVDTYSEVEVMDFTVELM